MRLLNGILGTGVNKVGNVIGATWKGIAYIRQYAIPKNPNTVAQQAVRSKMRDIGKVFSVLLVQICQKFWDPTAVKMSGYNAAVMTSMKPVLPIPPLKNMVLCSGQLEPTPFVAGTYDADTGMVSAGFDATCLGNGLATDKTVLAVYDAEHLVGFVNDSGIVRSATTITINIGAGRTLSEIVAWVFFYRGTAAPYLQSGSVGFEPQEP